MTDQTSVPEPAEPAETAEAADPTQADPTQADPTQADPTQADPTQAERAVVPDATFVGQPAKVMRIGTMVKQLLEEVRSAPLDDAARARLAEVHERSLRELEDGLSPDLVAELRRITLPFADDGTHPSDSELRVAQAQLVGWLEGLFHGLQAALVAQQMSHQGEQAQGRRALPAGSLPPGVVPGDPARPGVPHQPDERKAPGQYL